LDPKGKKGKIFLSTQEGIGGAEEELLLFLTTALDGDEWGALRQGCCIPEKEQLYPLNWKLGGLQSQYGLFWIQE